MTQISKLKINLRVLLHIASYKLLINTKVLKTIIGQVKKWSANFTAVPLNLVLSSFGKRVTLPFNLVLRSFCKKVTLPLTLVLTSFRKNVTAYD